MKIFTHMNLDLDAALSVCAAWMFIPGAWQAEVEFRPANWDGSGMSGGDIALDMEAGGRGVKGKKDADGTMHSCFAEVVKTYASRDHQAILAPLVAYVDVHDAYGMAIRHLVPDASRETQRILAAMSLNSVFIAFKIAHEKDDRALLDEVSLFLCGFLQAGHSHRRAEAEALRAELLGGGIIAIVRNRQEAATTEVLLGRGVRAVVYVDGLSIGVRRANSETLRMDAPEIRAIVEAAGECVGDGEGKWFAHSSGFLFCRGSAKAPAQTPSRVDPRSLAQAVIQLFEEERHAKN